MSKRLSHADIPKEIGARVRSLRQEQDMSQDALARATELSRGTITLIENGTSFPKVATLSKIADALGVDPRELLGMEQAS